MYVASSHKLTMHMKFRSLFGVYKTPFDTHWLVTTYCNRNYMFLMTTNVKWVNSIIGIDVLKAPFKHMSHGHFASFGKFLGIIIIFFENPLWSGRFAHVFH